MKANNFRRFMLDRGLKIGIVAYVVLNLVMVTFVPLLHSFKLTLVVLDATTSQPIKGALVAERTRELGRTDSAGMIVVSERLQENPCWIWPAIGRHRNWTGEKVAVTAPGYASKECILPDMRSWAWQSNHAGTCTVTLAH